MSTTAREPSRSASSIIASTTTGCHFVKIDGYSLTTGTPTGEYLKSHPFTLGGHRWIIHYYPSGSKPEVKDYISVFLRLDETAANNVVKARHQFRLWEDRVGEQPFTLEAVSSFSSNYGWGKDRLIKREELEESRYLKDDSFTVRCDIVVVSEFLAVEETAVEVLPRFVFVPPSSLDQHLGDLLLSEKGADVVFDVGGQTFAAHRCVLAARSPVFSAELFGTMKESDNAGVIHVEDMESEVFKALLNFVYTDSLPKKTKKTEESEDDEDSLQKTKKKKTEEDEKEGEDDEDDVMSQHLLVAADRYNLERLKLICEENLCRYINVDTVATILTLAEQHHCEGLKKACFYFLNTPANLRAAMATDSFKHLSRRCPGIMEELVAMLVT